ncbi:MAG: hypothetical protein OEQ39_00235 [Gammaproteobacteria bacterium]|nr:hypothetical protein [Gammaproteobacteria bacterium]
MPDVNETLNERGSRYGGYPAMAAKIKNLQDAASGPGYVKLQPFQQHAVDMILVKLGRILTGDPYYVDNWHDIEGYARLVAEALGESP